MQSVLTTVAPVFGLIALGFVLARTGYVSEETGRGVADFVFLVAVPALLFRLMLGVDTLGAAPVDLLVSYFGGVAAVWVLATLATRYILRRPATDGASIGLSSSFGNVVMLGLPLAFDRFGDAAATPTAIVVALSPPLLWFFGTLHIEAAARRGEADWAALFRELGTSLARNPIIIGLLAGLAWRLTGLGLHPVPDKMIGLLGQTAIPGSLVALGLSLTGFQARGQAATVATICIFSLVLAPALVWLLAFHVFDLPPVWAGVAVLLAACPPGANAFLFAARYDAAMRSVSAAIALGTALAAVSVTVLIVLLDARVG